MERQNFTTIKGNKPFSDFNNTRRDFIKMCSAATLGGVSSLLLPQTSEAKDPLELLKTRTSQSTFDDIYWRFVQLQFMLKPGLIYMNTGTEGSIPRFVLSRMSDSFKEFTENPWDALTESDILGPIMKETRTKAAEFLGANLEEILFTHNTTEGMSFTANGLVLQEGDEVLTTLHEHSAGLVCWKILKERRNVTLTQIELPTPAENKDEIIAAFENAITPQTKVMSFCHINFTTGLRMPVKELCQLAQDHGIISVVDGAHAIGMINLDFHDLGCDFYPCSPHKWLCAPPGTGVLYIREGVLDKLWPTVTEVSAFPNSINVFQGRGQQCTPAFACINDVINFQNAIGKDKIENRILALSTYLKEKIKENWGEASLFSPTDEELSSGLVSLNPFDDPFDKEKIRITGTLRDEYNIVTRIVTFRDKHSDAQNKRAIRVSTHIFNNYSEIDKLISAIKTII
ncbi:MAG: aminotransferase class V-fold PLP-dependent enzyme [Deltaproteobacteria bacterium]|nr:aminotransferase class V-fold PLP-dependent enzyme [Deltaproteobacteria bacterium]